MLEFESKGLNPFIVDQNQIAEHITKAIPSDFVINISKVFFYGAGCSDSERVQISKMGLQSVFINAEIQVNHDLLGAARAVCGNESGVVCILGTGSNSCYFDGQVISDNIPALGHIIGDEGAGTAIGKELLRSRFYRELPEPLETAFDSETKLTKEQVLTEVFYGEMPNRFLASLTRFCANHIENNFMEKLVCGQLDVFVVRHVKKYNQPTLPYPFHWICSLGISGSVRNCFSQSWIKIR